MCRLTNTNTCSILISDTANNINGGGAMDYKTEIIAMIEGIQNQGKLEYLHTFIKLFLSKWH